MVVMTTLPRSWVARVDGSDPGAEPVAGALLVPALSTVPVALLGLLAVTMVAGADPLVAETVAAALSVLAAVGARRWRTSAWVAAWLASSALGFGLLCFHPGVATAAVIGLATVIGVAGLALSAARFWIVAAYALVPLAVAAVVPGTVPAVAVLTCLVLVIAMATVDELRKEFRHRHEEEVEDHSTYRVTASNVNRVVAAMGDASSLSEVLPDLLDTVAAATGARVTTIILADHTAQTLSMAESVWVNGSLLEVEDRVETPFGEAGVLGAALRSPRPLVVDLANHRTGRPALLDELGLAIVLLCPMRLEGRAVGLLVAGDPAEGSFESARCEMAAAVAGSAAIVVAQLARQQAALELAVRLQEIADMKTDFVSMVSHELRSPLTAIIGTLDTLGLCRTDLDAESIDELLAGAGRQAKRLRRLIEDLLVVSRLDRGQLPRELVPIDLGEVVQAVLEVVSSPLVSVTGLDGAMVMADADHLVQIIANLVENALKYGGGTPVEVTADLTPDAVTFSVADHGAGIPVEQRDRVFERFVRLNRPIEREVGGTGLGLAIVHMLVEGMGGAISVTETVGGGATFSVVLPVAVAAVAA
jgi:signal transduction histidine kinase